MTLKDKIWLGVAAIAGVLILSWLKDSPASDLLNQFLRRKKYEDLTLKIKEQISQIQTKIAFNEQEIQTEAESYRAQKLPEDSESIKKFYANLFKHLN